MPSFSRGKIRPSGQKSTAGVRRRPPAPPRPDNPEPFRWFCCGRLNRVKGHDILIEAAALLRARRVLCHSISPAVLHMAAACGFRRVGGNPAAPLVLDIPFG